VSTVDLPLLGLLQTETGVGHVRAIVDRNVGILCTPQACNEQRQQRDDAMHTNSTSAAERRMLLLSAASPAHDSGQKSDARSPCDSRSSKEAERQVRSRITHPAFRNHHVAWFQWQRQGHASRGSGEGQQRQWQRAGRTTERREGRACVPRARARRPDENSSEHEQEEQTQGASTAPQREQPPSTSLCTPTRRWSQGKQTQITHEGQHAERTKRIHQVSHLLSTGNLLFAKLHLNS
jgi:hypothetical protein